MRAEHGVGEGAALRPAHEHRRAPGEPRERHVDRRVAPHVAVAERKAAEAALEQGDDGAVQPVLLVERVELVAHPHEARRARRPGRRGPVEPEQVAVAARGRAADVRPVQRVARVVLHGVGAVVQDRVQRHVFPEVVHPARRARLADEVVAQYPGHPPLRRRVRQVDHAELDGPRPDDVGRAAARLHEVAAVDALGVVVAAVRQMADVREVGVRVREDARAERLAPAPRLPPPVRVPGLRQLPVPEHALALRVVDEARPVLEPDPREGDVEGRQVRDDVVDERRPALGADDGAAVDPGRQGRHAARDVAQRRDDGQEPPGAGRVRGDEDRPLERRRPEVAQLQRRAAGGAEVDDADARRVHDEAPAQGRHVGRARRVGRVPVAALLAAERVDRGRDGLEPAADALLRRDHGERQVLQVPAAVGHAEAVDLLRRRRRDAHA